MNDIKQTKYVPIMEKTQLWFIGGGPLGGMWKDKYWKFQNKIGQYI